jgi:hypothetical protein
MREFFAALFSFLIHLDSSFESLFDLSLDARSLAILLDHVQYLCFASLKTGSGLVVNKRHAVVILRSQSHLGFDCNLQHSFLHRLHHANPSDLSLLSTDRSASSLFFNRLEAFRNALILAASFLVSQ